MKNKLKTTLLVSLLCLLTLLSFSGIVSYKRFKKNNVSENTIDTVIISKPTDSLILIGKDTITTGKEYFTSVIHTLPTHMVGRQ